MEREVHQLYSLFISEMGSLYGGVIMPQLFALTGPVAEELLPERDFIVLASFSRSFYLVPRRETTPGLICCCTAELEPGPLSLCWPQWSTVSIPAPGTIVSYSDEVLHWDKSRLDLSARRHWTPPVCSSFFSFSDRDRRGVWLAGEISQSFSRDLRGLNRLLPVLLARGELPSRMTEDALGLNASEKGLFSIGVPLLYRVQEWLRGVDCSPSLFVSGLIGLGPGLTPSGDDILGGMLIALHCLGRLDQSRILWNVIEREAHRTNRISQAHLYAAAHGMGAEVLHEWIHSLQGETDRQTVYGLCKRLGRVGHTSGWDAALGASLAFLNARLRNDEFEKLDSA